MRKHVFGESADSEGPDQFSHPASMTDTQWLKLTISKTHFLSLKDGRAIEDRMWLGRESRGGGGRHYEEIHMKT